MNILLVTSEFVNRKAGGLARYTYRMGKYLQEAGHHVKILVPGSQTHVYDYDGLEVHEVSYSTAPQSKLKHFLKKSRKETLYEILDRKSKAVSVYIEELHQSWCIDIVQFPHLGGLAKHYKLNVPSVLRLSSSTRLCYEAGGYGETEEEMILQERMEVEGMKNVNAVFGPSRYISSYVSKQIDREIEVIETPFQPFQFEIGQRPVDAPYLVYVGTLVKLKGVEVLADILPEVLATHPELNFVMIGASLSRADGEQMSDYLLRKNEQHKSRIHITGKLEQEQIWNYLSHAEGVVLPSLVDNFPNTCLEAMGAGKLVIGTYKNGFEQLIEDGGSGFLVAPGSREELIGAINKLLRLNPEKKKEMEMRAKERLQHLNPRIKVQELIDYYQKVINQCAE